MTKLAQIQAILGVETDGIFGPKSWAAINALACNPVRAVKASSFADPKDIRRFEQCKATGKTDMKCFETGDNGIGKWGDDTTAAIPMCALPREDWKPFGDDARGKKVLVRANGKEIICELRDTMPSRANIENGAGIDLNPAACAALGLKPPVMVNATWQWA